MLGAAFAARRPRELQRLVLASGVASAQLCVRSIEMCREGLPGAAPEVIQEACA